MMIKSCSNMLVVPPFECAWLVGEQLRFTEPGRGCIAFEACADNDVTVVFKEKPGSKHYRTDTAPNYTVVLGSHRNRRLRIEADGQPVMDIEAIILSPSHFQSFWINLCDCVITVGKGEPGQGVILQWADSHPTQKQLQFVGLSSWDKHVCYRNIRMLPSTDSVSPSSSPSSHYSDGPGLAQFLESPDLSDLQFIVGPERKVVPAHRVLLAACCNGFPGSLSVADNFIRLPSVEYPTLHALLEFLYTGKTQISFPQLSALKELSEQLGLSLLAHQCDQFLAAFSQGVGSHRFDGNDDPSLELAFRIPAELVMSTDVPLNLSSLKKLLATGEDTDVEIYLDDHILVGRAHRLVLSAWSAPFAKMFTNGMQESNMTKINLNDVPADVFLAMLNYMYSGHLELDENEDAGSLLLPLLLLADQFGIFLLQQECSQKLLECLSEDSVCSVLQVVSSMQNCKALQDACEDYFARHFEQCSNNLMELKELDVACLHRIIQNKGLLVTSEEKLLNAIICWASRTKEIRGWMDADEYLKGHSIENLFGNRVDGFIDLLSLVRFALFPLPLLRQLESCNISKKTPMLKNLAEEAWVYLASGEKTGFDEKDVHSPEVTNQGQIMQLTKNSQMFCHRLANHKELLYICDGDKNGVIYYAGTSYGDHPWMNPVLLKAVKVSASSPLSRYTDPKSLVSRQFQGTLFAGPCIENGQLTTWWKIDLGEKHQLMCNYYTLRQDGSMNYLRSWSLQGSSDDKHWIDLRVHVNDETVSQVGQYASWPVHGAASLIPFRFFRILLTGHTTSITNPWNLCICFVELYGYFRSSSLH